MAVTFRYYSELLNPIFHSSSEIAFARCITYPVSVVAGGMILLLLLSHMANHLFSLCLARVFSLCTIAAK